MSAAPGCRIGIDVGGTFTDFVLVDGASRLVRFKEPSVPGDPSLSVTRGLPRLIERAGIRPSDVELVVHGTTLALNAIIQRRGARMGLVVSRGNRGVLEIARAQLPSAFSFLAAKEPPLVSRDLVLEVSARLDVHGAVVAEATAAELEEIAATYRAAGIDAVTVMLLHAYANPEFEQNVADRLGALLPDVAISTSAAVWPERREYERCLMALMNAYIQPLMRGYLDRLSRRIRELGIAAPIYITSNNGGTLSIDTARQRPIDTILSGPASGVVAASTVAEATPFADLITLDMGGTSADMSVIQQREPAQSMRTEVGGLPLIVPVVAVSAVGAGGGSIVWVDPQGALKVGPMSAGADPGPACYGLGGTDATLTDCYLLAGYLDPAHFLGGRLRLDVAAAHAALDRVAAALEMSGAERAARAAEAAIRITTAVMSSEIARNLAQKGEEARNYALVAFGGAGPTHANLIAEDAGIASVLVPPTPSTFCALGAILANVKRDFVSSRFLRLADGVRSLQALAAEFDRLERIAGAWIATEGDILGSTRYEASADMRYAGQAFELPVPLSGVLRREPDAAALTELFHQAHEKVYSFLDRSSSVEITAERLRVIGEVPPVTLPRLAAHGAAVSATVRNLLLDRGSVAAVVYQRDDLRPGQVLRGPAIVEQEDTTTVVLPGWSATVDAIENLLIARETVGGVTMKLQMVAIAGMFATLLGYAQAQDSIRVGADVDAALLDPRIMRDTTAFRVCDLLFDGLVELDAKSQAQPGLAQSWDHPDATTWVFHLRDARFADGTPVSADDVAYTFQTTLDPKMASRFRGWLTPIKAITAADPHTVRMELSQPYAPLLGYMELGIVPKAVAAAPNADLSAHPVGSGPMRLAGWKRGNAIVLEANPGYWGGAPKLKRMEIVVVGDNTARAQALEAGDLDFVQSPLSPQDVHRLMGEQKFTHVDANGQALTFLLFNTSDSTLADPAMRRALAHLIDQKTILSQIYGGIDQPANEMLLPTSLGYDASLRQPAFDPAEAGKELDALGWKRGGNGRRAKEGKKLAITLSTHSEDPNRVQTMEFLQAVFTDAGIDTKVSLADFPSFFAAVRDGRTQIALLGMALNVPDPDRVLYDQMHTGGGNNWARYGNSEVDAALEQGRRGEDRLAAYRQAETILARDLPLYVLSYQGYQAFYRPALHFEPNPRGYLRSLLW